MIVIYRLCTGSLHSTRIHTNYATYIAEAAKCTTRPPSKLLTSILTAVKKGLQSYHHNTYYSRSCTNSIWILKNSEDLLETLNSKLLSKYNSIKTYDFSTFYTSIPHNKLKSRLKNSIHRCYSKKGGTSRCQYVVLGEDSSNFLWATRRVFLEKLRTLTLPVHLFHAPSISEVWVSHSHQLLCMYYFVCLFSMSGPCPWITFFWFQLESW